MIDQERAAAAKAGARDILVNAGLRVVSIGLSKDDEGWFVSVGILPPSPRLTAVPQLPMNFTHDGVRVVVAPRNMAAAL